MTKIIFCLAVILAFVPSLGAQGLAFTTNIFWAGSEPDSIAVANVSSDSQMDLICADTGYGGGNTLLVLTNDGSGIFSSNSTLIVGSQPVSVVAADINDDGNPDLICANLGDNTLSVLTNNGSGIFSSNATINAGIEPNCVIAADLNGDGKMDLVCANLGTLISGGYLMVFTNNGNGIFGSNATYSVENPPGCVLAVDVNGDGKLDLVCANYGGQVNPGNTLSVFTNNGSGQFGLSGTYTVGEEPYSITAADINGDGKPDLICANYGNFGNNNTLSVLTNNGSGIFGLSGTYTVGYGPRSVIATDIYSNGKPALICANASDGTVSILTNNGCGIFGSNETFHVGNIPSSIAAADVNGDGKLDLICANADDNAVTVLTQIPSPLLTMTPMSPNSFLLSWSSFSTNFILWTNQDLTTTNWSPVGFPITINNGTNQSCVATSPPAGNLFFRLQQ